MKYRILQIVALLILLANLSSCGQGRWQRYKYRGHYINKKQYRKFHTHHNRDW